MKVRLQDQEIRFRLDEDDVRRLVESGSIQTGLSAGETELLFGLRLLKSASNAEGQVPGPEIQLRVEGRNIGTLVSIPAQWTQNWESSDLVGFEFDTLPGNLSLDSVDVSEDRSPSSRPAPSSVHVVIEKDYPCAHTSDGKAVFGKPLNMNGRNEI